MSRLRLYVEGEILDNPETPTFVTLKGRDAWALLELHRAGAEGCTPLTHVGPRWSGYVYSLRKAGLMIETVHESRGEQFAGRHARYVLRSRVRLLGEPMQVAA
jgi:hypothetical protein